MGFDHPRDESEFSKRHGPRPTRESACGLNRRSFFANRGEPLLDSGLRKADLQSMATARRLCERTMTSKLDQRLSPMAATR